MDSPADALDIQTIAWAEIVSAVQYDLDSGHISHESCPEVGANDWLAIEERIRQILKDVTPSEKDRARAYLRLVERADS